MTFKTKTYEPGRFDIPIEVKQKTKTQNEYGEEVITLTTVASPWAERELQQSREFRAGTSGVEASKEALVVVKYTCRYIDGLTYDMVIVDDGVQYDITKVGDKNRKQYSEIIAQAHVS